MPSDRITTRSGKTLPGRGSPPAMRLDAVASEAITRNQIVYLDTTPLSGADLSTTTKGYSIRRKVGVATNATKKKSHGELYVALTAAAAGDTVEVCPIAILNNLDTSGSALGNPVYLSTAGLPTLTATGFQRRIGTVIFVGTAGNGLVDFDPRCVVPNHLVTITGTATVLSGAQTVTITAATLGGTFGNSPAWAALAETDGAIAITSVTWSADDLVVKTTANVTANRVVRWFVMV